MLFSALLDQLSIIDCEFEDNLSFLPLAQVHMIFSRALETYFVSSRVRNSPQTVVPKEQQRVSVLTLSLVGGTALVVNSSFSGLRVANTGPNQGYQWLSVKQLDLLNVLNTSFASSSIGSADSNSTFSGVAILHWINQTIKLQNCSFTNNTIVGAGTGLVSSHYNDVRRRKRDGGLQPHLFLKSIALEGILVADNAASSGATLFQQGGIGWSIKHLTALGNRGQGAPLLSLGTSSIETLTFLFNEVTPATGDVGTPQWPQSAVDVPIVLSLESVNITVALLCHNRGAMAIYSLDWQPARHVASLVDYCNTSSPILIAGVTFKAGTVSNVTLTDSSLAPMAVYGFNTVLSLSVFANNQNLGSGNGGAVLVFSDSSLSKQIGLHRNTAAGTPVSNNRANELQDGGDTNDVDDDDDNDNTEVILDNADDDEALLYEAYQDNGAAASTITRCTFRQNYALHNGAAMEIAHNCTVRSSIFTRNTAGKVYGFLSSVGVNSNAQGFNSSQPDCFFSPTVLRVEVGHVGATFFTCIWDDPVVPAGSTLYARPIYGTSGASSLFVTASSYCGEAVHHSLWASYIRVWVVQLDSEPASQRTDLDLVPGSQGLYSASLSGLAVGHYEAFATLNTVPSLYYGAKFEITDAVTTFSELYVSNLRGHDSPMCGGNVSDPCKSIGAAVSQSFVNDTIWIEPGTYNTPQDIGLTTAGWISIKRYSNHSSSSSSSSSSDSPSLLGDDPNQVLLSCVHNGPDFVLYAQQAVFIEGITLTDCPPVAMTLPPGSVLRECSFIANRMGHIGVALLAVPSGFHASNVSIESCLFESNQSPMLLHGGGLRVVDSVFRNNTAVLIESRGWVLILTNTSFVNNSSPDAPTTSLLQLQNALTITRNSEFIGNRQCLFSAQRGALSVFSSSFIANSCSRDGIVLSSKQHLTSTFQNCVFIDNVANAAATAPITMMLALRNSVLSLLQCSVLATQPRSASAVLAVGTPSVLTIRNTNITFSAHPIVPLVYSNGTNQLINSSIRFVLPSSVNHTDDERLAAMRISAKEEALVGAGRPQPPIGKPQPPDFVSLYHADLGLPVAHSLLQSSTFVSQVASPTAQVTVAGVGSLAITKCTFERTALVFNNTEPWLPEGAGKLSAILTDTSFQYVDFGPAIDLRQANLTAERVVVYSSVSSSASSNSIASFTDCHFVNNTGELGGAFYMPPPSPRHIGQSSMLFRGCLFSNNTASLGGGALALERGTLLLTECQFEYNSAPFGSAILVQGTGQMFVNTSSFTRNTASEQSGFEGSVLVFGPGVPYSPFTTTTECFNVTRDDGSNSWMTGVVSIGADANIDQSCVFTNNTLLAANATLEITLPPRDQTLNATAIAACANELECYIAGTSPSYLFTTQDTCNLPMTTGGSAQLFAVKTVFSCPSGCGNHGKCLSDGTCSCDPDWGSPTCLEYEPFGVRNSSSIRAPRSRAVPASTSDPYELEWHQLMTEYHRIVASTTTTSSSSWSWRPAGSPPTISSVVDLHNGNYSVVTKPLMTAAGRYCVNTTFLNVSLAPPSCFSVLPGEAVANMSMALGKQVNGGLMYCSERRFVFVIEARDLYGNRLLGGNDTFVVQIVSSTNSSERLTPSVRSLDNGHYLVYYNFSMNPEDPTVYYTTTVLLENPGGQYNGPISGANNVTTAFRPTDINPNNCSIAYYGVEGGPSDEGLVGNIVAFNMLLRNYDNEVVTSCALRSCIEASLVLEGGSLRVPVDCSDCNESVEFPFHCTFNTTVRGKYDIEVLYAGERLRGDSLCFNGVEAVACYNWSTVVTPARADPSQSYVLFNSFNPAKMVANQTYSLIVQTRDQYDNQCDCPEASPLSANVSPAYVQPVTFKCETDHTLGLYKGSINFTSIGTGQVTILVYGQAISNGTLDFFYQCKEGSYLDSQSQQCIPCPAGTYQNVTNLSSRCIACPGQTSTNGKTGAKSETDCSCEADYYGSGTSCLSCKRSWTGDTTHCLGGRSCDQSYAGYLCLACNGTASHRLVSLCVECNTGSPGTQVAVGLLVLVLISYLSLLSAYWADELHSVARFFRLVAVTSFLRVGWPYATALTISGLSLFNLNVEFLALGCLSGSATNDPNSASMNQWWISAIVAYLLPVLLQFVIFFACMVSMLVTRIRRKLRQPSEWTDNAEHRELLRIRRSHKDRWFAFRKLYWGYFVAMLSFFYVPALIISFAPFACGRLSDGTLAMLIEPSLECFSASDGTWWILAALSSLYFVLFGIGTPVLFLWLLRTYRGSKDSRKARRLREDMPCIARPYEPRGWWWWNILPLFEEFVFVAVAMLVPSPTVQLTFLTVLCVALTMMRFAVRDRLQRKQGIRIEHYISVCFSFAPLFFIAGAATSLLVSASATTATTLSLIGVGMLLAVLVDFGQFVLKRCPLSSDLSLQDQAFAQDAEGMRSVLAEDDILRSWEIAYEELEIINPPIAKGNYGIVNKAIYNSTLVAVKTLLSTYIIIIININ